MKDTEKQMDQQNTRGGRSAARTGADKTAILRTPRGAGVRNGSLLAETAVAAMLETGVLIAPLGGVAMTASEINLAIDREGLLHERIAVAHNDEMLYLLVFHDNSCLIGRRVAEQNAHKAAACADWSARDVIQIDPGAACITRTLTLAADGSAEPKQIAVAVRLIRRHGGRYLRLGVTTKENGEDHWSSVNQPFGSDMVARTRTMLHEEIAARASAIASLPVLSRQAGALTHDGPTIPGGPSQSETPAATWPIYMTRRPGEFGAAWPAVNFAHATLSANNTLEAGALLRAIIQARVGSPVSDPASPTGQSTLEPGAISEIRLVAGTGPHTIRSLRRPAGFVDIKAPGANPDAIKALRATIEDDLSGWLDLSRLQGWSYSQNGMLTQTRAQRRIKRSLELEVIVSLERIADIVARATMHERIATLRAIRQAKAARTQI